jgi:hypothetical protein
MGFKGAERGYGRKFVRKVGVEGFARFQGVRKDGDPGSLSIRELRVGENARFKGDDVQCRGGQTHGSSLTGVPNGIWPPEWGVLDIGSPDSSSPAGLKMFFIDTATPNGGSPGADKYDTTISAVPVSIEFTGIVTEPMAVLGQNAYWVNQTLPTGANPKIKTVRFVNTVSGVPAAAFAVSWTDDRDGGLFLGGVANGKLWLPYWYSLATPSNGKLYSWDGASLVVERTFSASDTGSVAPPGPGSTDAGGFCPFQGGWIWARHTANPQFSLMVFDSKGALSFKPLDQTTDPDLTSAGVAGLSRLGEYNGVVYMGGTGTSVAQGATVGVIWKYDGGPSVIEAHKFSGLGVTKVFECVSFNGFLYYVWTTGIPPTSVRIGRFDGTTWTDSFATVATQALPNNHVFLAIMGGSAYVLGGSSALPLGLLKSSGTDLTTWAVIANTRSYGYPG